MISRRAFAFAAPLAAFPIRRLRAAGVDGKWEGEVAGPGGPMVMTFDLKADGEALTGTVGSDLTGTSAIEDGKVSADALSFVQVFSRGGREIRFKYEGKLMGEELELTRSLVRPTGAGGQRGQGGAPAGGRRPAGGQSDVPAGGRGQGGGQRRAPAGGRGQGGGQGGAARGGGMGAPVTFTAKRVK